MVKLQPALSLGILKRMYSPAVLDHSQNPRNMGDLPDATHTVDVTNPVCGDELKLAERIDGGRIAAVKFRSRGCKAAVASASLLTELMEGKTLDEIRTITAEQISRALGGLPAATRHGSQLAEEAVDSLLDRL
jgi:nitrogen fixation NifU-like protein